MREAKIFHLNPADITIRADRATPLNPAAVEVIRQSVEEGGEIRDPIHVREIKGGHELIDGRHRLEVATMLGLEVIPARVWACTLDEARLMEADANVTFTHMSPVDLAVSLAKRKEAYERLHPETRRGVAGAMARHGCNVPNLSFAEFIAELIGVTPRNIRRVIAAGAALAEDEVIALRKAPRRLAMQDIQELSKIADEDERQHVVRALAAGEAKKVAAARKAFKGEPTPVKDPVEEALKALRQAWARAPKAAKRRFVAIEAAELDALRTQVITPDEQTEFYGDEEGDA